MFVLQTVSEGHNQERSLPAPSSPPSSPSCSSTQTRPPAESPLRSPWVTDGQMEQDPDSQQHHHELQSSPPSRPYEELFCSSQSSHAVGPLTGALVTSCGPHSDVVKQGFLGKLDRNHRRYFVLRAGSHTGPGRLEWYKNQEKSAGKAALSGSSKLGVMYLRCCLGVSRSGSSRKGHTVALYAKDQTMVLVVEDQWEQEAWYLAMRKLMEEERKDEERGEGCDEEDDGYCTLPSAASFKEVWPVTVRPTGLGCTKSLSGESRLCLTATSLILVRVTACSDLPSLTIPLLSVRRFGHLDGSFYLELGRSAPNGPGEIWMGARDQGNPAVAHRIHEVVIETVRTLRALPDFSRSPASSRGQLQALLPSKRGRPKYRDKAVNVRPPGARPAPLLRNPETQTSPPECPLQPDRPHRTQPASTAGSASHPGPLASPRGPTSETDDYVEMKTDQRVPVDQGRDRGAAMATGDLCSGSWEPGEAQRLGYMMMSPPGGHGSPALPQDDYVTMASPQKPNAQPRPSSSSSSLQTSFDSFTSDSSSPLRASHHRTNEHSPPRRLVTSLQQSETGAGQSQRSIRCSSQPQEAAESCSSPVRSVDPSAAMTQFVQSGPDHAGPGRASRAASDQSGRRWRLSLCLPSCLLAEDGDGL
uniref:insulin receptor substrate 2-B-like isoform X2 n=1 Tax=Gasterosteus aculeatus aculeatus TaxID=481459 RepID=UPI001A97FAE3|nr:insulin receptor substrate 2-B-like isoform X2 [Gasterosteus aculeatus aculeatus]